MAKIDDLKKRLESQKKLRNKYKDQGKDSLVKKFDKVIEAIEKDIKGAVEAPKPKAKPKTVKKKPAKKAPSKVVGNMTLDECKAELEILRGKIKRRDEKNIKEGKAEADGSLKASASLDNEADIIANKAESGQIILKKEQKTITVNIKNIVKECISMIKTQKDSETLLRDLIRQLNGLQADVKAGKLRYEG